jgi:aspartate/methionine/tyrosine aminotransferase
MKLAGRLAHIDPFYVMECAKVAREIALSPACDPARGGEPMIYLNIGEPDFTAPAPVIAAAEARCASASASGTRAAGAWTCRRGASW